MPGLFFSLPFSQKKIGLGTRLALCHKYITECPSACTGDFKNPNRVVLLGACKSRQTPLCERSTQISWNHTTSTFPLMGVDHIRYPTYLTQQTKNVQNHPDFAVSHSDIHKESSDRIHQHLAKLHDKNQRTALESLRVHLHKGIYHKPVRKKKGINRLVC